MAPKCVLSALVIVLSLMVTPVLAEGGSKVGPSHTLLAKDSGNLREGKGFQLSQWEHHTSGEARISHSEIRQG